MKKKLQKRGNMIGALLITCLLFMTTSVFAQVTYSGNGNSGFGGVLGTGDFSISDNGTTVTITFNKGSADFNDPVVIYIDSETGGFSNTNNFTDTNDESRKAVSGYDGTNRSTVNFPAGFEADFAIAANPTEFNNLFDLENNQLHNFIGNVNLNPNNSNTNSTYTMTFDFSDINTSSGTGAFKFVATYLNQNSTFRSDEAIGDGIASGNPGSSDITFDTYFQYSSGDEGGLATTASEGDWSSNSTWTNGNVPLDGDEVVIDHDVTLNQNATVSDITISSGKTLTSESAQGRILTIQGGGTFTNNGTFTANVGSVSFPGAGTIAGTTSTTFNNVDIAGGVDFGSNSTIDGNLTIQTGGFVNTNPPTYSGNSTLIYSDDNNTYARGLEWSSASGVGYPNNVTIEGGTTLNLGANGGTATAREITGNLMVKAGSTLSMNETGEQMTAALTVLGDLTNNGTVKLSSSIGGDLKLQGNFTDNGTFTANSRAVFFEGGSTQNINSTSNPLEIDVMRINKSGGEVVMNQNLDVAKTQDPLIFSTANSFLNLSNFKLRLGELGVNSTVTYNGGSFKGNTNSSLTIRGDGDFGDLIYDGGTNNTLGTLTINRQNSGSVTLPNSINIATQLNITSGSLVMNSNTVLDVNGTIANDGNITFKSELDNLTSPVSSKTAQLDVFNGSITGTGDVTVERFIPAGANNLRAFRFLSTAVNSSGTIRDNWQNGGSTTPNNVGTHITGTDLGTGKGFDDSGSGNPSLFVFDNTKSPQGSDSWGSIPNTNSTNLKAGKGYNLFVRGDRSIDLFPGSTTPPAKNTTLRSTGTLATGSLTTDGTDLPVLADGADEFSFIGNPYQAIVDITQVLNATNSNNLNTNFYWVWDPNKGTNQGGYVTVELPAGTNSGTSDANEFVQPGQSFFVQNSSTAGTNNLTFTEAAKDVTQTPTQVFSDNNQTSINLLLYKDQALNNNDSEEDALGINFTPNANNGVDQMDAAKFTNIDENLARSNNGNLISIENRAMPVDDESLELFTNAYSASNYTFVVNISNLPDGVDPYLVDDYADNQTLLSEGTNQISFTVDPSIPDSEDSDRFSIDFDVETFGVDDNELADQISLYPNPSAGQFTIQTKGLNNNVDVRIYNMTGKQVFQKSFKDSSDAEINVNAGNLATGVYMVEMNANKESYTNRLIIK